MKQSFKFIALGAVVAVSGLAHANILSNGNLDVTYQQEIVPGFFLPKPDKWINEGIRQLTGPYEDEMSSEPWAGPAPTPVTHDGFDVTLGTFNGNDWGVFFKPFSGSPTVGAATGHLYQDVQASAGLTYTLTGWAGAEANALMKDAQFAIEFLDANGLVIGGNVLSLMPTLFTPNGQPFNYKQYSLTAVSPTGTAWVRARASMIEGLSNPLGGGQAYVVDDFDLGVVPEPATMTTLAIGAFALLRRRQTKA